MFFQRVKTDGIAHNAYLIASEGEGVLIDPRRDVEEYLTLAAKNKFQIRYVLETHRQEDFILGSAQVRELIGAKIVSGKHEFSSHSDIQLADGEALEVGSLRFVCLNTPGHTPESVSYAAYMRERPESAWAVFTGDALFVGEAGRTDLPDPDKTSENAELLYDSIHRKILPLGDQTILYPAHGSGSVCGGDIAEYDESTLGFERSYNPAFTCTKEEFVRLKLEERIPRPPYFKLMEQLNLKGGTKMPGSAKLVPSLSPESFEKEAENGIVIDTRLPEAYAGGHLPGSYSIWLGGLPVFGGWIADDKTPTYLVLERPDDIESAYLHLTRIGVDNIKGVLAGGFEAWRDAGKKVSMSGTISALSKKLDNNEMKILDVREIGEFEEEGRIEGSYHAYVGFLPNVEVEKALDPNEPIAVTCSVGHRASLAVSMLLRRGYKNVRNILGGITARDKAGLPLVKGVEPAKVLDEGQIAEQTEEPYPGKDENAA